MTAGKIWLLVGNVDYGVRPNNPPCYWKTIRISSFPNISESPHCIWHHRKKKKSLFWLFISCPQSFQDLRKLQTKSHLTTAYTGEMFVENCCMLAPVTPCSTKSVQHALVCLLSGIVFHPGWTLQKVYRWSNFKPPHLRIHSQYLTHVGDFYWLSAEATQVSEDRL